MQRFSISFWFLLILLFGIHLSVVAQSKDEYARQIVEQRIEELSANSEAEYDFTELFDRFMVLYQNPISINIASAEQLRELVFLNENQISQILERRKKVQFQTIYELKDLDGFYINLILSIQPFITFEVAEKASSITFKKMAAYGSHQVLMRYGSVLETQEGYRPIDDSSLLASPNSRYLGNRAKLYMRYKYTYKDRVSFGVLGDKDAGEEFFVGSNPYGFDFYSAHLFLKNFGKLKALAIGDYHLEFGQGLTLWSSLAFGKSATSISLQRQGRGLRANTSANEILFFRGAAATYSFFENIDVTAFYSKKGIDAGLILLDTADVEDFVFSGIQESGYHATPSEMAKKKTIGEQLYGGNITYKNGGLKVGVTGYQIQIDKMLYKDADLYQINDFQGDRNFNAGIDAAYSNGHLSAFGEYALSANGGQSYLVGSYFNLNPRLLFTLLYRHYGIDYQNFYAVPVSESGKAQNEQGLYFGAAIQTGNLSRMRLYYDLYKFPWLKYRVDQPSNGSEFSIQFERIPNRAVQYYFRYRFEEKMLNQTDDEVSYTQVTSLVKHNAQFNLINQISKQWRLQSRLSFVRYQQHPQAISNGYLLFQDIDYDFEKLPLGLSFRYAVFNTDDYNSRLYAYEKDVLYKFSVPGYYYKGQRYYVLLNYKMNDAISIWLRFSQTYYTNKETISSGLDEIQGHKKSEVTAQVRMKL